MSWDVDFRQLASLGIRRFVSGVWGLRFEVCGLEDRTGTWGARGKQPTHCDQKNQNDKRLSHCLSPATLGSKRCVWDQGFQWSWSLGPHLFSSSLVQGLVGIDEKAVDLKSNSRELGATCD